MIGPARTCQTEGCSRQGQSIAGKRQEYSAYLFTRRRGVLPVRVVTQYCKGILFSSLTSCNFNHSRSTPSIGCHTTYRPNYIIQHAQSPDSKRLYYSGVPELLEVAEHTYIEKELVALFRAQMAFAQCVSSFSTICPLTISFSFGIHFQCIRRCGCTSL